MHEACKPRIGYEELSRRRNKLQLQQELLLFSLNFRVIDVLVNGIAIIIGLLEFHSVLQSNRNIAAHTASYKAAAPDERIALTDTDDSEPT